MKANELRIGNLIIGTNVYEGKVLTFERFNSDLDVVFFSNGSKWDCGEFIEDIKPIQLTEEWLFKFGFKKSNVYCFGNHKLIIESLMGDRHSCRYRVNPDESIWISELHYVHQLQNLYCALTGEELTFKSE